MKFTREEILTKLKSEWIKEFRSLKELDSQYYFISGFVNHVFDELETERIETKIQHK